jgi:hypothetical protein
MITVTLDLERIVLARAEEQLGALDFRRREPGRRLPAGWEVKFKEDPAPDRCKVAGCWRKKRAKGLCSTHYERALDGRPMMAPVARRER